MYFVLKVLNVLFLFSSAIFFALYTLFFLPNKHKNRQNFLFCLFYRFIEDNFQSFIPWFVRDIR